MNKYPSILDRKMFYNSQDFPVEIIIKLYKENKINKKTIECILTYNLSVSYEDKNKLKTLLFT